jgi:serine/threonine protein kinase
MSNLWDRDINKDEIIRARKIGEGQYGQVWEATCRATQVAVKIPNRQKLSPQEVESFKKEIEIMRKITHPNVCLFMGAVAEVEGNLQIVTELLKGDIESEIFNAANSATLLQRLKWAKDAAQGMAWLHGNNPCILHRDLKPSNLLIDHSGTVKVADFGLADLIQQGDTVRQLRAKGSPIYMAPEVMKHDILTTKVDVYSFGIVVWEIVQKKGAFDHHSDYQRFSQAVVQKHERPPVDNLHPDLAAFLNRCWAPNPNDRPSFPEICVQLDDLILTLGCEDAQGRLFWKFNFNGQIKVPWKDFLPKFYRSLGRTLWTSDDPELPVKPTAAHLLNATTQQKREYAIRSLENFRAMVTEFGSSFYTPEDVLLASLKLLFIPNRKEEYVMLDHFGAVLGWIGPFESELIDRYAKMIRSDWFHGFMSKLEAEERLRNEKSGTFLVRFSNNNPKNFVISKVSVEKGKPKVSHLLVKHTPGKGFSFDDTHFTAFEVLLAKCSKKFHLSKPCANSIFKSMVEPESGYTLTD